MEYPAVFQRDRKAGGYLITFPDIPEAITQGDSEAEAMVRARDALETALSFYIEKGIPLPRPRKPKGKGVRMVSVCALAAAKLALYSAWLVSGLRKAELARRLGIPRSNVDRLFDLMHNTRLDQIEAALSVFGKALMVDVRDAA
jgi:antitoxin HicB